MVSGREETRLRERVAVCLIVTNVPTLLFLIGLVSWFRPVLVSALLLGLALLFGVASVKIRPNYFERRRLYLTMCILATILAWVFLGGLAIVTLL